MSDATVLIISLGADAILTLGLIVLWILHCNASEQLTEVEHDVDALLSARNAEAPIGGSYLASERVKFAVCTFSPGHEGNGEWIDDEWVPISSTICEGTRRDVGAAVLTLAERTE